MAEEKLVIDSRPKEETKPKPEIIDIEISGTLLKKKAFGLLPSGKEENAWYIKNMMGVIVFIPNTINGTEVDFTQFENREVITKGKGVELLEKNEKGEEVKVTKFIKLISIELKAVPIEIAEKPLDEKKEVKKEDKKVEKK